MQDYITKDALVALGIKVDDATVDSLITHLNETVEERIGAEITESLTDQELEELVKLQETASDQEVAEWIASHVPEYKQIVQDTIDIVIGELAEGADDVNASTPNS